MQDVFGSSDAFDSFTAVAEAGGESLAKQLHAVLRPFILRRLKTDVKTPVAVGETVILLTSAFHPC